MNNVAQDKVHLKLVTSVFQNMFPAINVDEIRLREIRRVLLLHHNTDTDEMELRHYDIGVAPVGMSSRVKKLVRNKRAVPDLSKFQDVSDFVLNAGDGNDSDAEEMVGEANSVVLPQNMGGAGNVSSQKSAVKLTGWVGDEVGGGGGGDVEEMTSPPLAQQSPAELGPRINMSLIKVEEGFCGGDVLFHKFGGSGWGWEVQERRNARRNARRNTRRNARPWLMSILSLPQFKRRRARSRRSRRGWRRSGSSKPCARLSRRRMCSARRRPRRSTGSAASRVR